MPPIRTPLKHRVDLFKRTILPGLVFCGALVVVGYLWRDWVGDSAMAERAKRALANDNLLQVGANGIVSGPTTPEKSQVRADEFGNVRVTSGTQ